MPHTTVAPTSIEEILATATPDPDWTEMLKKQPIPVSADFGDIETLKYFSQSMLPRLQATLRSTRLEHIKESEITVNIPATDLVPQPCANRVLLCYPDPATCTAQFPLVVLIHGGGHCIGDPETEVPLARRLAEEFSAAVIMPCYRLAPEHKFPAGFNDNLELIKILARSVTDPKQAVLPADLSERIDVKAGLILGGTSAGSNISAGIAKTYRDWQKRQHNPLALSGLFLSATIGGGPKMPAVWRPYLLSREQNKDAAPLEIGMLEMYENAICWDPESVLWQPIDQHPELKRDKVGDDHVWMKEEGVRAYFQVCGADMLRDNCLIFERVLRDEAGVETRLDLYTGYGHCFWTMGGGYKDMEMSHKRMQHSVDAVRWLLRRE